MRALLATAALLACAAASGGCLGWETRLVLAPDGSGTATVRAGFDPAAAEALRARVRAEARRVQGAGRPAEPGTDATNVDPRPPRPLDPIAPGWFHAEARGVQGYALLGVQAVAGLRFGDGPAIDGVEATSRFEGLEAAARGGLFHGCEVALERRPKGRALLTVRPPWEPSGPGADDAFGGAPAGALAPFAADVAALSYRVTITFPEPVLSTNATLSEDRRTVTYEARGPDGGPGRLEVEVALSEDEPWPTFRHRPDLAALARRLVLPPPPVPEPVPSVDDPAPR